MATFFKKFLLHEEMNASKEHPITIYQCFKWEYLPLHQPTIAKRYSTITTISRMNEFYLDHLIMINITLVFSIDFLMLTFI